MGAQVKQQKHDCKVHLNVMMRCNETRGETRARAHIHHTVDTQETLTLFQV